jgi:hypothetical protein
MRSTSKFTYDIQKYNLLFVLQESKLISLQSKAFNCAGPSNQQFGEHMKTDFVLASYM